MKTIICDLDGTLTDMWPIEKSVLLSMLGKECERKIETLYGSGTKNTYLIFRSISKKKIGKAEYVKKYNRTFRILLRTNQLPTPVAFPIVNWLTENKNNYRFVYATGGQKEEAEYVLKKLKLSQFFDLEKSISKSNCRFSKKTGLVFKKLKRQFPDCFLITDSESDCVGAKRAKIGFIKIKPEQTPKASFFQSV
jgi:phosphoglycolate phosphatase-like HAD superfamily hydrolase